MDLLCFRDSLFVSIKHAEIIQNRCDIGMFRPQFSFVNLQSTQVIWFGAFAAPGFSADESDIVQQRAEIGEGQFGQLRSGISWWGRSLLPRLRQRATNSAIG